MLNSVWPKTHIPLKNQVLSTICSLEDQLLAVSCIGIEDPDALAGPLVTRFLMKLTRSGLISKAGWENLAEFIIAVRFAWLAEWLRNGDREMIELELVYMKILVDNRAVLFR